MDLDTFNSINDLEEAKTAVNNCVYLALFSVFFLFLDFIFNSKGEQLQTFLPLLSLYLTVIFLIYFNRSRTAAIVLFILFLIEYISNFLSLSYFQHLFFIFQFHVYFRGISGTFAEAKFAGRPILDTKLIVRNSFIFTFWLLFTNYFLQIAIIIILSSLLGDLLSVSRYEKIISGFSLSIIIPLISILASYNKLPGIIKDPAVEHLKRKVKMFQQMFNFSFNRSFVEAVGFYVVYLSFSLVLNLLIISFFDIFIIKSTKLIMISNFFFSAILISVIVYKKNLYKNPLIILMGLSGIVASYYGGPLFGLIAAAYLTTVPAMDKDISEKTAENLSWYHSPTATFIISFVFLFFSLVLLATYESIEKFSEFVDDPHLMLSKVFYSQKDKIYLEKMDIPNNQSINIVTQSVKKQLSSTKIANYYKKVTVSILTFDKNRKEIGTGSGFIISKDGFIITNYHVVSGAYSAKVILHDGRIFDKVYYIDKYFGPHVDACLLKINAKNLQPAILGDSSQSQVGDEIITVGNPMGFQGTVSNGIISAFRKLDKIVLMQITAPVSLGSSGGPVINKYGEVIGITTLTYRLGQNINFAVPINYLFEKN